MVNLSEVFCGGFTMGRSTYNEGGGEGAFMPGENMQEGVYLYHACQYFYKRSGPNQGGGVLSLFMAVVV